MDGAAIVNMRKPTTSRTFDQYADREFIPYIKKQLEDVHRIDVVWDKYLQGSIKEQTRESRGEGTRRRVSGDTVIPANWSGFLRNNSNKEELFAFLSEKLSALNVDDKQLYATKQNSVVTAHCELEQMELLQPCEQEEADTRMFLHAAHAARLGHQRILLRTVDTDVVVIAIRLFHILDVEELWIAFGVGKNYRSIPVHDIAKNLGPLKSAGLSFFHAFTGCDTTSAFAGRGKKTAWDIWSVFPEISDTFKALSDSPEEISSQNMAHIERFVVLMYSKTSSESTVNNARQKLFYQGSRSLENILPTQVALLQHVKRSVYQAGYKWCHLLVPHPHLPSPAVWGWMLKDTFWTSHWLELPEASHVCRELIHCGCKKSCRGPCKCYKSNLPCIALCACSGNCSRQ